MTKRQVILMVVFLPLALVGAIFAIPGCSGKVVGALTSEMRPRSFFAANGITAGTPVKGEDGTYRIPLVFETEVMHSALSPVAVEASSKGSEILVSASYAVGESRYPGFIELNGVKAGDYELKYLDPDGTTHPVAVVVLP